MLSSSQTDFNYDVKTSSYSPGPPARDDGTGRGSRNVITEAVSGGGLRRGSDGPGRNDSERRNDYQRRNHNERQNDNWDRDNLRNIALTTLRILDHGEYFPPGQDGPYDLEAKILWTDENTRYYGPDAGEGGNILESEFMKVNEEGGDEGKEENEKGRNKDGIMDAGEKANDASYVNEKQGENESENAAAAASKPCDDDNKNQTRVQSTVSPDPPKKASLDDTQTTIYVREYSTLVGARKVHLRLARNVDPSANKKIGVLNFASAKKPGGGFINGSQAQEESLARSSTLYPSLVTEAASQFYAHYHEDPGNAYYTHAMVYSPGIVLVRDDNGEWCSPVEVDVLTSAAVNAGEIRRELEKEERERREKEVMEYWKKKGAERRKENERAMAERQRLREKNKNEKEEIAKLKKEQANLVKLQKEISKEKETDKGMAVAEVENGNEKGEVEKPKENQENTMDSADNGLECGSDSQLKGAEENTNSKGTLIQDDQLQPKKAPEVNQKPNSSSTIVHPLLPPTQPSQAPDPDPYAVALKNVEIQIEQIMYARISRILHLFQLHQTLHLILGSFGTGVFKNRIDLIATIFADLLIKPDGRFKDIFQTVVFAILGKETVRVFSEVFSRVDKRAGRTRVFVETFWGGSDEDVKEGGDEKTMRKMKWEAKRSELERRNSFIPDAAANPAHIDAVFHPLSFDAAQASASSAAVDATSYASAQADAAAYAASSNAVQACEAANAASFNAFQVGLAASATSYASSFDAAQVDAAVYTAFSDAAQACAAASTAFSNAAQARAVSSQADEAALLLSSAAAYAALSNAWRNSFMYDIPNVAADTPSFHPAKIDGAFFHPLPFDAAHASAFSYPTSSASADAGAYAASSNAAQVMATANAASSNAVQAGAAAYAAFCAHGGHADVDVSAILCNAAQACAAASAALSHASHADAAALFQGSAAAYSAFAKAWRNSYLHYIPDAAVDAASFDPAQIDGTSHPFSFDAAQANTVSYLTSSTAADATSYAPSFDAAEADAAAYAASSNAYAAANAASYLPSFEADAAASAVSSNAAQACAAASAASSNAAQTGAVASQVDVPAVFQASPAAYATSSNAWRKSPMHDIPDGAIDAASFDPAQVDLAFRPLSFDASAISYPTSSAAVDAASYSPSFMADAAVYSASSNVPEARATAKALASNVLQASENASAPFCAPSFNAARPNVDASAALYSAAQACAAASDALAQFSASANAPSFDAAQADAAAYAASSNAFQSSAAAYATSSNAAPDAYGILESLKMISTRDDEQVDFVAEATTNASITPKTVIVDDGKDVETSLPTRSREVQSSKSMKKED